MWQARPVTARLVSKGGRAQVITGAITWNTVNVECGKTQMVDNNPQQSEGGFYLQAT